MSNFWFLYWLSNLLIQNGVHDELYGRIRCFSESFSYFKKKKTCFKNVFLETRNFELGRIARKNF